jgi:phospholipid N-methyltransferase
LEVIQSKISNKKELGQYFSGRSVACLLADLAKCVHAKNIIDPMCGIGDMFSNYIKDSKLSTNLTGIEIDTDVYENLKSRIGNFPSIHLLNGNAFSKEILKQLQPQGYDLVITNPPYVRYQTINKVEQGDSSTLNIKEIRSNLIECLSYFETIDKADKDYFKQIISNLSGLSDLAVPSWILSALLVKKGGKIAMVVPETWLNRDYALIVKYLLFRWFKIEYIIEDANSAWFQPAQVKTTLIVAKRIKRKKTLTSWADEKFIYAATYAKAMTANSLVGNIFPESISPELDFIKAIDNEVSIKGLFESKSVSIRNFANDLKFSIITQKWYKLFEKDCADKKLVNNGMKSSSSLRDWYGDVKISFCHLQDIGVSISQGLRTGANDFFYLNYKLATNEEILVAPHKRFNLHPFTINRKYFRDVVRKQSELDNTFTANEVKSDGVVLSLQSFALPEDILFAVKCNAAFNNKYEEIPEPLANYIRKVSTFKNGNKTTDKLIPDLSAVKTNIKKWNEKKKDDIPRFWYSLPEFTKRHFPDLFIPRINTGTAKTRLNNESKYLIDANFSSLWISNKMSPHNNYSLLALLNSTWATVTMEEYGTVMGGGALKLEATQLKKIPFPILSPALISRLMILGENLSARDVKTERLIFEIDSVILEAFGFQTNLIQKLNELSVIKQNLLKKRIRK